MDTEDDIRTGTDSEEEEDDEMIMLATTLYVASTKKSKIPCHTSKLSGAEYTCELLEGHKRRSYDNLRMEPRIFKALSDYLGSKKLLRSTRGVTVQEQVAMFLYMLARNASFTALCDRFQHSGETIHRHIAAAFNAITKKEHLLINNKCCLCFLNLSCIYAYVQPNNPALFSRFPLYNSLELLYEGQIAEGKHCFTSGKPQHATSKGFEGKGAQKTLLDFSKQNPWATAIEVRARPPVGDDDEGMSSPRRPEDYGTTDLDNEHSHFKGNKKRSHQMMESSERQGMEAEQNDLSDSDEDMGHQSDDNTSSRSATAGSNRGRLKRSKDKKPVPPIEESLSEFVSLRKQQAVAKDMVKKQGQEFSVTRCLAVLNAMDVSDELKIGASDVFKDAVNREMFLGYDSKLRGLWLRKEVNKLGTQTLSNMG